MSTERSPSPESIEQTKQQIRTLVNEISQLSKSDLGPDEYYPAFLQRIVQALAAVGGAVWTLTEGRRPQLTYQININETLLDAQSEDATKHAKLLTQILANNQPQLVPPMSSAADERQGGNPTNTLLVLAPLQAEGNTEGLVEIFQRPDSSPQTQRGYLRFLVQMCELASEWVKAHKLRTFSDRHSLWSQADQFARLVHESLDLRETAYTLVNEGRRLIGCDRVSLAIRRGNKCIVETISGQDSIESRSNIVTALNRLATTVVMSGEPLWYFGSTEDLPPQVEQAIDAYVEESYAKTLAILPVRKPKNPNEVAHEQAKGQVEREGGNAGEIVGALIIEQLESDLPRRVLESRIDMVYEHGARAVANALDHENLFLMPVWKTLGKATWVVKSRNLPKTLTIGGALLVLLIASLIVPMDFEMKSKGELKPVERRDVFVQVSGNVDEVLVRDGDLVKENDVLARLKNYDLDVQLEQVLGELDTTRRHLSSLMVSSPAPSTRPREDSSSSAISAEISKLRTKKDSLERQLELLQKKRERLVITSPMSGVVMLSWDVEKTLLHRPVAEGQVLMTVARPDGEWELELNMPERRMKHVTAAQARRADNPAKSGLPVRFILATDPSTNRYATVVNVHKATEMHETEGHTVLLRCQISAEEQAKLNDPHPGASVTARVLCGRSSVAYAFLHEALEWIEANIIFPLF